MTFREKLKSALEAGVLMFVKHALVVALWLGTGLFVWSQVGVLVAQARNGQLGYQFLLTNQKELNSLIESRKLIDQAVAKTKEGEKK